MNQEDGKYKTKRNLYKNNDSDYFFSKQNEFPCENKSPNILPKFRETVHLPFTLEGNQYFKS